MATLLSLTDSDTAVLTLGNDGSSVAPDDVATSSCSLDNIGAALNLGDKP